MTVYGMEVRTQGELDDDKGFLAIRAGAFRNKLRSSVRPSVVHGDELPRAVSNLNVPYLQKVCERPSTAARPHFDTEILSFPLVPRQPLLICCETILRQS